MFQSHTLRNARGLSATITNFGARIVSLNVPDREGKVGDVVLGYDDIRRYETGNPYYGAIIGRYGNRIAHGKFEIEGASYSLSVNNGANSLHGGPAGFHNVFWKFDPKSLRDDSASLVYDSFDGEEGYPGNLSVRVTYLLTANGLSLTYHATTDQATIINLTSHAYFNLANEGSGDILNHKLTINADYFTPVNSALIPTGELRDVGGTPFDFRSGVVIGNGISHHDAQLEYGLGYDHNWVLNKEKNALSLAAIVEEPTTGRVMEVFTTEPGLQFYSGNFLEGQGVDIGKAGKSYGFRSAFCLEAQHFPDSPHHAHFPSTVLLPGEEYFQETKYVFKSASYWR